MLVLFETPAGYSLFKVSDEKKLKKTEAEDMYNSFFDTAEKATNFMQLLQFQPFSDTAQAVSAATACMEGKVTKTLKKFLKGAAAATQKKKESLAVADKLLASSIKEALGDSTKIVHDAKTAELFRGIRCYMEELMSSNNSNNDDTTNGIEAADMRAMQLGLSHSLSRYKLKFSADKVDTMVIQAVGLLDELDKEINTYAMRVKEWYGWHFPEMQAIVPDNAQYAKVVLTCGFRSDYANHDLSSILDDDNVVKVLKETAEISMGTEISELDRINIASLAEQVLSLTEYRAQLFEYLKNRMNAIAPNLTILVGELVGARLISHAGSLMNLAKQPASTVQILGAEKALFRALKTKHDTPKYGLIYHASLIGQAAPKHKGKISRVLAAKAALAIRVDALSDDTAGDDNFDNTAIGYEGRAKVEARLRQLEGTTLGGGGDLTARKTAKYSPVAAKAASAATPSYNEASDMVMDATTTTTTPTTEEPKSEKKKKKEKKRKSIESTTENGDGDGDGDAEEKKKKKKEKKKRKAEDDNGGDDDADAAAAKKAAKKAKKEKRKSKE